MRKCIVVVSIFLSVIAGVFAQDSILDVIKAFDEDLMNTQSKIAHVTIGFITYADSETCGTVVPFLQDEIKAAAEKTRRIKIVKTTELSEYEQAGIATRNSNLLRMNQNSKNKENKFNLDGKYYDRGKNVELVLTLYRPETGEIVATRTVSISNTLINERQLTLYPSNVESTEEILNNLTTIRNEKESIHLAASMLDHDRCLVDILHPKDKVFFKILSDADCYIALLNIDANGEMSFIPLKKSFLKAGEVRFFPSNMEGELYVKDDGVLGAEHVIIFASTDEDGLPSQILAKQDLEKILKDFKKQNLANKSGVFKIPYTILPF